MTPEEHITEAERLLAEAQQDEDFRLGSGNELRLLAALVHANIALAVEGGVPHSTPAPVGT